MKGELTKLSDTRYKFKLGQKTYYIKQHESRWQVSVSSDHHADQFIECSTLEDICEYIREVMSVKTNILTYPKQNSTYIPDFPAFEDLFVEGKVYYWDRTNLNAQAQSR